MLSNVDLRWMKRLGNEFDSFLFILIFINCCLITIINFIWNFWIKQYTILINWLFTDDNKAILSFCGIMKYLIFYRRLLSNNNKWKLIFRLLNFLSLFSTLSIFESRSRSTDLCRQNNFSCYSYMCQHLFNDAIKLLLQSVAWLKKHRKHCPKALNTFYNFILKAHKMSRKSSSSLIRLLQTEIRFAYWKTFTTDYRQYIKCSLKFIADYNLNRLS